MRKKSHWLPLSLIVLCVVTLSPVRADEKPDTHAAVIEDLLKTMKGISDAFDSIQDAASANKATPKLNEYAEQLEKIVQRAQKLKSPPENQDKDLKKKYASKLESTFERFQASAKRVSRIKEVQPILQDFGKRLLKIGQAMKKVGQ